jgi:hypothetical protein
MNLNRAFYKEIQDALNTQKLSNDDFKIDVNGVSEVKVNISYLYDDSYYFNLKFGSTITFSRCPGPMTRRESGEISKKDEIFPRIRGWLDNIENETKAAPGLRELIQHRREVDEKLSDLEEKFSEIGQEEFSKEEILEFKIKLEEFREEFTKKLESEIEDKAKLQSELKKVSSEIDFLKSQVDSLSKVNLAKALFVRAMNWRKRNPKVMGALVSLTRELLPEGVKEHIPDEVVEVLAGSGEPEET